MGKAMKAVEVKRVAGGVDLHQFVDGEHDGYIELTLEQAATVAQWILDVASEPETEQTPKKP